MKADVITVRGVDVLTKRILVISHQDILTNRIASILKRAGFEVVTCSEGIDGVVKLDEIPCQAVILDEALPNCQLVCHQIRTIFHVPVLMLGNHSDDGYWQRASSIEIDAHVPKTISGRELTACVKSTLRRCCYANAV